MFVGNRNTDKALSNLGMRRSPGKSSFLVEERREPY